MECKVSSGPRLRGGDKFLLHLPPLAAERIPFLDVRIMLGQRPRENMAAVALGDEEEIVVRLGVEDGGDRRLARVRDRPFEIGRGSCRERVCQYVSISVVAVTLKKKTKE